MTRSILADCDPRFWPWAIKHAAFIWNHSSRQDENVPPPVVRAGLCPLKEAQRILKKYTKIEFGADDFVLRSQRAKKHRFNIRSVREEGKYLGLNIRQRGMVVRIGNRNYIRNNVVPKPKSSEAEEEDQEPLDEDDNDDSENDDDYYEEDDDEDEDDDDKDADDDDEDDDDDHDDHDDDDDDDDDNVDNVGNFDDDGDVEDTNDEDEINKEDEHIHDEWADASGESEEVLNESLNDILLLSPGRDSIPEYTHKIHRSDIAKPKFGLGMTKEDDPRFRAKKIELTAMDEHQVWDVVDYSPGMKPITCKWVLSDKFDAQGHFDKKKARLVARGFQQPAASKKTNYAPVMNKVSMRMIFCVGKGRARKWDVKSAFLNGELEEVVYMRAPPELDLSRNKVLALKKAIYGLCQASFRWWLKLCDTLRELGFRQSELDPCVFYRDSLILGFHVDDFLITGNKDEEEAAFREISKFFTMRDEGQVTSYLGISYEQIGDNMFIQMSSYIDELLTDFEMSDCKPVSKLPYVPDRAAVSGVPFDDVSRYASLVGALSYVAQMMRPDIMLTVRLLAQFMNKPSVTHWRTGKELLRYLKHTRFATLRLTKCSEEELYLRVFSDADFAQQTDRKSIVVKSSIRALYTTANN